MAVQQRPHLSRRQRKRQRQQQQQQPPQPPLPPPLPPPPRNRECEHRIFGCYVRRVYDVIENVGSFILTVTDEDDQGHVLFHYEPRYYENDPNYPNRHVLVFIDSFFYFDFFVEGRSYVVKLKQELFHPGGHLVLKNGPTHNTGRNGFMYTTVFAKVGHGLVPRLGTGAPICALFPVIEDIDYLGMNWIQKLALGLYFLAYWDRYDIPILWNGERGEEVRNVDHYFNNPGHRMYHRFQVLEQEPPQHIPVHDLWEEFLLDRNFSLCPNLPFPFDINGHTATHRRIGFYVCTGAKLVVIDGYHNFDEESDNHNRTLILPGGLVAVRETEMRFAHAVNTGKYFNPVYLNLIQILSRPDLIPNMTAEVRNRITGIKNPVFFLGAIQSKYNSAVWSLGVVRNVNRFETTVGKRIRAYHMRTTDVLIPDHSVIEAVEEWDVGIAEVIARHKYHQLHRGVTRLMTKENRYYQCIDFRQFEAPEQHMLTNITTEIRDTRVEFDFTQAIANCNVLDYVPQPLQREYYFSSSLSAVGLQEYITRQIPPPPPAAYPPVLIGKDFYYLPNVLNYDNQLAIDVSKVYHKYEVLGNEVCIDLETNGYLKLQPRIPIEEYLWFKVKDGNPNWDKHIGRDDMKLCFDGHWYQKEKTIEKEGTEGTFVTIGKITTQYYQKVDQHINPSPQLPQQLQSSSQPTPPTAQGGSRGEQSQPQGGGQLSGGHHSSGQYSNVQTSAQTPKKKVSDTKFKSTQGGTNTSGGQHPGSTPSGGFASGSGEGKVKMSENKVIQSSDPSVDTNPGESDEWIEEDRKSKKGKQKDGKGLSGIGGQNNRGGRPPQSGSRGKKRP